jgi:hypothetical protein
MVYRFGAPIFEGEAMLMRKSIFSQSLGSVSYILNIRIIKILCKRLMRTDPDPNESTEAGCYNHRKEACHC